MGNEENVNGANDQANIGAKVPQELKDRIDKYHEKLVLNGKTVNVEYKSFSATIRRVLEAGLTALGA